MAQGKPQLKFESNPCSNFRDNRCHWRTTDGRLTTDKFRFHELCWHSQAELKITHSALSQSVYGLDLIVSKIQCHIKHWLAMAMTYMCIVNNVVIYIHYSMVTAFGSIVIQEFIFRNKILLLLLLIIPRDVMQPYSSMHILMYTFIDFPRIKISLENVKSGSAAAWQFWNHPIKLMANIPVIFVPFLSAWDHFNKWSTMIREHTVLYYEYFLNKLVYASDKQLDDFFSRL